MYYNLVILQLQWGEVSPEEHHPETHDPTIRYKRRDVHTVERVVQVASVERKGARVAK
jgi:hypothetical protein